MVNAPRPPAPTSPAPTRSGDPARGQYRWALIVAGLAVLFVVATLVLANRGGSRPDVPLSGRGPRPSAETSTTSTDPATAFTSTSLATFARPWLAGATCVSLPVGDPTIVDAVGCRRPGLSGGTGIELVFLAVPGELGCADDFPAAGLPGSVGLRPEVVPRPDGQPGQYCESTIAGSPQPDDTVVNGLMISWTATVAGQPVLGQLIQTFPADSTAIFTASAWPALRAYWRTGLG